MNHCFRFRRLVLSALALLAASESAIAGDFIFRYGMEPRSVSGTTTVNGYPMPLPAGSSINGPHAPSAGTYGGLLYFPSQSFTAPIQGLGTVTLTVQWIHLGTSNANYFENTGVTMSANQMYLDLQSAIVSGTPVPLSNCRFGPVTWNMAGAWNTSYAQVSQNGFTIPPRQSSDCSGFGTPISNSIAGSNNSVTLVIDL